MVNRFVTPLQFTDDYEWMALCEVQNSRGGQIDYQVTLWQFEDVLRDPHSSPVRTISDTFCQLDFGSQGEFVAHSHGNGMQLWSTFSSKMIARSEGEDWWVVAAFGPDETVVFGIDYLGEMTAWRASDMTEMKTFQVSPWHIQHINFIHNGTLMVLPADDGTIRLWGILADS